jgi:hypothetical protein
MKVYRCIKQFFCSPINQYIPVNANVARYESATRIIIDNAPRSDNKSNFLVDGVEYDNSDQVTWFYAMEDNSDFFVLVETRNEDDYGNVGSSDTGGGAQGPQGSAGGAGNQGNQGNIGTGNQGNQGWQGIIGSQGNQGLVGATGFQGVAGTTPSVLTITGSHTAGSSSETVILANATSNNIAITLPPAADYEDESFVVKKIDASSNTVTVSGDSISELIDNSTSQIINIINASLEMISDGSNWWII